MEVELVLSLVKNDRARTIDNVGRYLLTPMGRKTMHDQDIGFSQFDQ
jgi:hypothetical protein